MSVGRYRLVCLAKSSSENGISEGGTSRIGEDFEDTRATVESGQ